MKKWLIVSTLLFFAGCAAFQPNRHVENNLFVSDTPKLYVKINPEYKYVGNQSITKHKKSVNGLRTLKYDYDNYCFIKPKENVAEKGLAIQIETISTHFISDIYRSQKDTIDKGMMKYRGNFFQFYTKPIKPSNKWDIIRQFTEQGYKVPYGIVKCFGKIYGEEANILVNIYYYERLSESDPDFKSVYDPNDLTSKQRDFLKEFDKRAMTALDISH
jgi:hypothetical protein